MLQDHREVIVNDLMAKVSVLEKKVEHLEVLLTFKIAEILNQVVASTGGVSDITGSSAASGATV